MRQGEVVLIEFWTYGCINCLRTLPHVIRLHDVYENQGLVVIGIHTPEFPFERQTRNVRNAIKRFGIRYPVAQDNGYATWNAYENRFWPVPYVVDRHGTIVLKHFGENDFKDIERTIRTLLAREPL